MHRSVDVVGVDIQRTPKKEKKNLNKKIINRESMEQTKKLCGK